jgi:cobalt-zinc-cadmium efflux system outer membrane protein
LGLTVLGRGAALLVPAIVCLLSSAPRRAEAEPLALQQVVRYSLQNNVDLKSFREEKGIREAGQTRAGLLPNPTLELEGESGALTGSSSENSVSLGVSQEFLLSGKREKRLTLAERELELYRGQLADQERLRSAEVKAAFYAVILAEQRVALADRAIALNRQLLDVAKERLAAGDIPELELNLVKVELARSESSKITAADLLNQSQARLWTLMGVPAGEAPAVAGNLDAGPAVSQTLVDLKRLALENRPDLKALQAEKGRGDTEISLAQAEALPNLTAGVALKRETTSIELGGLEGKDTAYSIGIKLSMPIPVFDKNQAGLQEARARRNSSESRLSGAYKTVEREVATAYASLINADQTLSLYRMDIIPQFKENLELTQEAYRLGEVGILTVFEEQRKFSDVNAGYLEALHDRQLALLKLESAVATELTGGVQ